MNPCKSIQLESELFLSKYLVSDCDKYYILHWTGTYLINKINQWENSKNVDMIEHQDVLYQIHTYTNLTMTEIMQHPRRQYRVSFRRLRGNTLGVALVTRASISHSKTKGPGTI